VPVRSALRKVTRHVDLLPDLRHIDALVRNVLLGALRGHRQRIERLLGQPGSRSIASGAWARASPKGATAIIVTMMTRTPFLTMLSDRQ